MTDTESWRKILASLPEGVTLVAVSKTKPAADIRELYDLGQRHFGENYVQELVEKSVMLPADIHWHFIGHLQSNKVKLIAPFVHLIHGVDSFKLLQEISRQAAKAGRVIDVLLQVHIAQEETKFGLDEDELKALTADYNKDEMLQKNARITGLMGMATNTDDETIIRAEFRYLRGLQQQLGAHFNAVKNPLTTLSMGMSADYNIAVEEGSTMVRIGSLLFGHR